MALTDENGTGMVMPVAPMYGGGYGNNGGFGNFGGDWGWIILLLLIAGGGWGNGFGGFGGGVSGFAADGAMLYPWMNQAEITSDGFRDQMMNSNITSIRDGVSNLSTQLCGCCGDMQMALANGFAGVQQSLCSGFAGTTAAVTGAQNAVTQQLYTNELSSLNRSFAEQTANTAGFNSVNTGVADLKYTVATEACADRAAINDALRDVIAANTASTQKILDQMCQDKIDAKNDEIAQLRQQLNMASLRESQTAQNAFIAQGFSNEVDQLYNRLNNCPVPSTPVYGRTPIFTCNSGCGCGCGMTA